MTRRRKSKNFKTNAPFGVNMRRFISIGIHPGLDPSGSSRATKYPPPGEYDPKVYECSYKKQGCSSWKRKQDVEEFSQNLGFRNGQILKERTFRKSMGGPGIYEIPESIFQQQRASCMYNVGFGMQKRFWNAVKENNPPPGTYVIKTHTKAPKHFSKTPTFDRDGFIDRFRSTVPPYAKPPNLYNPLDTGSINALLTKVVSKRGPYDLFTGPRDYSSIKNHFSLPAFKGPLNWFNTWPTELENLLNHPSKARCGRFLKEARFGRSTLRHMLDDLTLCYRDPDDPSPCHYTIESTEEVKQNMYPFNNSVKEARPPTQWKIHPGVGRYNPSSPKCQKVKQETYIFKSVVERTKYKAVEYNSF